MSSKKLNILVCNDDGVHAKGIRLLAEAAAEYGNVHIVAPDRQQSAVGHAITIQMPLRSQDVVLENGMKARAVSGTPADCVKLAHDKLLGFKPDLVLSGINHGSNAGVNILYSGTVSAATEGAILGYPAIAVSCTSFDLDADMSGAQEAARKMIELFLEEGLEPNTVLNVNAPEGPLKDIRWTRQGRSRYVDEFEARVDPFKRAYYWMTGRLEILDEGENMDLTAIANGYASVTPIQFDLTHYDYLDRMERKFGEK